MIAPNRFALRDRLPRATVSPAGEDAVCAALRSADENGEAVVIHGGGTLQSLGNLPRRYDLALSTRKLRAVLAYDPRDLTIGVEAGLTVSDFAATLERNRQFVPLDVPQARRATIGGTLASGWLGPRRALYGRARDLVIGTTAVLADGTLAHAGGMVVKNVTGYDVGKLYIGSLGTLGAIVRANFKTLPMPGTFRLAIAPLPEGTLARAADHVASLEVEPSAALVVRGFRETLAMPHGADGTLALVFEGSEPGVERATRGLRSALGAAGVPETRIVDDGARDRFARLIDTYISVVPQRSITLRALGAADAALHREAAARRALDDHAVLLDTIVDLRCGDLIARIFVDGSLDAPAIGETLTDAVRAMRGALPSATVIARGIEGADDIDAWGSVPASLATMRTLKTQFDPRDTLAPGRYIGGI